MSTLEKAVAMTVTLDAGMQDFEEHGLRADLNPTMELKYIDGVCYVPVADMYAYLRRVDESVRQRAKHYRENAIKEANNL
jgi:hypothetical protein